MSKSAGKKPKEKSDKTKATTFVWTEDEVQLLLEVTNVVVGVDNNLERFSLLLL